MNIFEKHLFICTSGKTCAEQGSQPICEALRSEIKELGLKKTIRINKSGCLDQCGSGPMIVVYPQGHWYCQVSLKDVKEIIEKDLIGGKKIKRLVYKKPK